MELKPPRRKRPARSHNSDSELCPLPVLVRSEGELVLVDSAPAFAGCLVGYSVLVEDEIDCAKLYEMGYFGKGSLSRGAPTNHKANSEYPPVVTETQWKQRLLWAEKLESPSVEESAGSDERAGQGGKVLVVSDPGDGAHPVPRLVNQQSPPTVVEVVHLSLEEAFFLSYGLGCLEVSNLHDCTYLPDELWRLLSNRQPDFVESYVAYHHYRAKGWIVKTGLKYGGNFLLYSKGPQHYHASYIVVIQNIDKPPTLGSPTRPDAWEKYSSLNRVAEQTNKDTMICQVKWPSVDLRDFGSPEIIKSFCVKDCVLNRWNPSAKPSVT